MHTHGIARWATTFPFEFARSKNGGVGRKHCGFLLHGPLIILPIGEAVEYSRRTACQQFAGADGGRRQNQWAWPGVGSRRASMPRSRLASQRARLLMRCRFA